MFRRNAGARIGNGEMTALVIGPPTQRDRPARRCVLRRIVDEIPECGVDKTLIAHQAIRRFDPQFHRMRLGLTRRQILAQQRQ